MSRPETTNAVTGDPNALARRTILIVDDHPFMRDGLSYLINAQTDLLLGGQAGNPVEAFAQLAKFRPDLVLTDISMPGRSGLEFVKDLLAQDPKLKVLVLSAHDELLYAERALHAGARGYIMKGTEAEAMLTAIRLVLRGEVYVSPPVATSILGQTSLGQRRPSDSPIKQLTDREFEIFQLIGQGKNSREIAEQLHLSAKTIDTHRANMRAKLDLQDATALVRYAVRWVETK